jgi:hypothetical protein
MVFHLTVCAIACSAFVSRSSGMFVDGVAMCFRSYYACFRCLLDDVDPCDVFLDSLYASCHAYVLFSLVEVFSNLSEDTFVFKKKWKRVITLNTETEPKNRNIVDNKE